MIGLSIAIVILIIAMRLFISSVKTFRNTERGMEARNPFSIFYWKQEALIKPTEKDIQNIDGWMTFGYINHQFSLPEELFVDKLTIQDKKYPRISLGAYAKKNNITREDLISQVRAIVSDFTSQVR